MSKLRGSMIVQVAAAALVLATPSAAMAATGPAPTGSAARAPAAASCGDSWKNPAGGTWSTGSDWSTGAPPTASQHACITIALTAPVVLTGAGTAGSLTLGGTRGTAELEDDNQVLTLGSSSAITRTGEFVAEGGGSNAVDLASGATLTNDGVIDVTSGNILQLAGDVTNAPDGWVSDAGSVLAVDTGTFTNLGEVSVQPNSTLEAPYKSGTGAVIDNAAGVIQNQGSILVGTGGTFDQGAGQLIGAPAQVGSYNLNGGSLDLTGAGAGRFELGYNATLTGNIAAGQTVIDVGGGPSATGSFTNDGTLMSGSGGLEFTLPAGDTLTNAGTIAVPSPSDSLTVAGNVVNDGTIAMNGSTFALSGTVTLTNHRTITVPPQSTLETGSAGTIDNAGGTIANGGEVDVETGGTFAEGAGTTTGNTVYIAGALKLTGSGAASFGLWPGSTISGTIAAHQVVLVYGNSVNPVTAAKSFTNHGTLFGRGYLTLPAGGTLTNDGTLEVSDEGGGGATFDLEGNLTNTSAGVIGEGGDGLNMVTPGTTFDNAGKLSLQGPEDISLAPSGCAGSGEPACDITFDNTGTIYVGTACDIAWGGGGCASAVGGALGDTVNFGGTIVPVPEVEPNAWPPPAGESIKYGMTTGGNYSGGTEEWSLSCGGTVTEGWSMSCPNGANLYENDTTLVPTQLSLTGSGTEEQYSWDSSYGQPVTLTATVTAMDDSTPAGSVAFYAAEQNGSGSSSSQGATAADLVGTASLSRAAGGAKATLTYNPPPGQYALLAVYSGDSSHLAASAGATAGVGAGTSYFITQVVGAQTTGVTVKSSAGSAVFGKPVILTATVKADATGPVKPTGVVTFDDGGVLLGTAPVTTKSGVTTAKLTTDGLPAGSDSITATYSGDYNYAAASTSSSLSQTVTAPTAPTKVIVSGPSTVKAGATYKATSTTDGTGAVLFSLASSPAPPKGMTISPGTGAVSYKVPATGTAKFSYTVVASNAAGQAASRKVTVRVS